MRNTPSKRRHSGVGATSRSPGATLMRTAFDNSSVLPVPQAKREAATPVRSAMRAVSRGNPPSGYRLTLSACARIAAMTPGDGG